MIKFSQFMGEKFRFINALGISIALHLTVATMVYIFQANLLITNFKPIEDTESSQIIDVSIFSSSLDTSPEQANFVAASDQFVERQQVRKNSDTMLTGTENVSKSDNSGSMSSVRPVNEQMFRGLRPLKSTAINSNHLDAMSFETMSLQQPQELNSVFPTQDLFNSGSSAGGYHDLKLPEGEITLLNAKSHRYAAFIIRVAKRVFYRLVAEVRSNPALYSERFREKYTVYFDRSGQVYADKLQSGLTGRIGSLIVENSSDPNPPTSLFLEYTVDGKQATRFPFLFIVEISSAVSQTGRIISLRLTAGLP